MDYKTYKVKNKVTGKIRYLKECDDLPFNKDKSLAIYDEDGELIVFKNGDLHDTATIVWWYTKRFGLGWKVLEVMNTYPYGEEVLEDLLNLRQKNIKPLFYYKRGVNNE